MKKRKASPESEYILTGQAVNETPQYACYWDLEKHKARWGKLSAVEDEYYAFTKQVTRELGVVAVGCDPEAKRFWVKANKDARRWIETEGTSGNTWTCANGDKYRIDVLEDRDYRGKNAKKHVDSVRGQ